MLYTKFISTIAILLLALTTHASIPKEKKAKLQAKSEAVYGMISEDYSDILDAYYALKAAGPGDYNYYNKKLVHTVFQAVQQNGLPFYGNFFNNVLRNFNAPDHDKFPLKNFDQVLLPEAIGHLKKHCFIQDTGRLETTKKAALLLSNLQEIGSIIRFSDEYNKEEKKFDRELFEQKLIKSINALSGDEA
jgi:hypothetical protein